MGVDFCFFKEGKGVLVLFVADCYISPSNDVKEVEEGLRERGVVVLVGPILDVIYFCPSPCSFVRLFVFCPDVF